MREVNFSIPNVNKASVGITTALYDRRALDCTSTLPLINSLNHLAYLTTSSARIRDILTVDGGIERLVCLLKEGRSRDMMDIWKWNLAFQCVVNIGVRGTEAVRTRVVEADMVPVIATILDNYIKVVERCREKAEEAKQRQNQEHHHRHRHGERGLVPKTSSFGNRSGRHGESETRSFRRHAPPPSIDVSAPFTASASASTSTAATAAIADQPAPGDAATPTAPQYPVTSPPERPSFPFHRHTHHRGQEARHSFVASPSRQTIQPLASAANTMEAADGLARPVYDRERLISMMPSTAPAVTSQPASPTTPLPPPQLRSPTVRPASMMAPTTRSRRRPSIRHQDSTTVDSDNLNDDSMQSDESPDAEMSGTNEMQATVGIQDITMEESEGMLGQAALDFTGAPGMTVSETQEETGTFNITHRTPMVDVGGSILPANTAVAPANVGLTGVGARGAPLVGFSPNRQPMTTNIMTPPQPVPPQTTVPRYPLDRHQNHGMSTLNPHMLAAMPRDEDVLMSLQLLAYVSKYCNLRSYFQRSHLVPRLKIDRELLEYERQTSPSSSLAASGDRSCSPGACDDDDGDDEEYLLPNDFNIFPLVERFTVRYHSSDMQYWAGVVMRNLCRKDDTRGGIRQCAYYKCGKWEEFTRQFAKCRRCRRTKYCSKECQKNAWAFHRHWCVAATQ